MQTFLPYANFVDSAQVLDYRRLGKQRVETKQILNALAGNSKGWVNHPATVMWRGYETALAEYGFVICTEWIARGYKDSLLDFFNDLRQESYELPNWLGNEDIHISHQSNLIRKDPAFYIPRFGNITPDLPYVWGSGR